MMPTTVDRCCFTGFYETLHCATYLRHVVEVSKFHTNCWHFSGTCLLLLKFNRNAYVWRWKNHLVMYERYRFNTTYIICGNKLVKWNPFELLTSDCAPSPFPPLLVMGSHRYDMFLWMTCSTCLPPLDHIRVASKPYPHWLDLLNSTKWQSNKVTYLTLTWFTKVLTKKHACPTNQLNS